MTHIRNAQEAEFLSVLRTLKARRPAAYQAIREVMADMVANRWPSVPDDKIQIEAWLMGRVAQIEAQS